VSVADIATRIGEIQTRMASLATLTAGAAPTKAATAATGAAFATALADAQDPAPTTGAFTGDDVVNEAQKYLGVPYKWGGNDPASGLDCSGLVKLVYDKFGIELPRLAGDQVAAGTKVDGLANAHPGDLLAFGSPVTHIGIYMGNNQMIHAPRPGKNVEVSSVYETPSSISRLTPTATAGATTTSPATVGGANVGTATPYANLFNVAGRKYGIDPALLSAVAKTESNYNPQAVSPVGAQGLMQIMPGTAKGLGVTNALDPAQAVDGAAKLLSQLHDKFGDWKLAIAAYNAGAGAVSKYSGVPPYAETQNYVRKVTEAWKGI
jgi:hypothetical protein